MADRPFVNKQCTYFSTHGVRPLFTAHSIRPPTSVHMLEVEPLLSMAICRAFQTPWRGNLNFYKAQKLKSLSEYLRTSRRYYKTIPCQIYSDSLKSYLTYHNLSVLSLPSISLASSHDENVSFFKIGVVCSPLLFGNFHSAPLPVSLHRKQGQWALI